MKFFTDLDNTIIFSYKHDIGIDKVNIELYQRKRSFICDQKDLLFTETSSEKKCCLFQ